VRQTLNILGAGKVGMTLGRLWQERGTFEVQDVMTRHLDRSTEAITFMGGGHAVDSLDGMRPADLYLIASPDDAIAALAVSLATSAHISPHMVVFHVSGAQSSQLLAPVRTRGAATASAHPVASFADPHTLVQHFAGTFCTLEGDTRATDLLRDAFEAIGARTIPIIPENKLLYHAGAVFASNYLVVLLETALATYELAGIERGLAVRLMEPLVRQTMENTFRGDTLDALGGPIARGDKALVRNQYAALTRVNPQIAALYRILAAQTSTLLGRDDLLQ